MGPYSCVRLEPLPKSLKPLGYALFGDQELFRCKRSRCRFLGRIEVIFNLWLGARRTHRDLPASLDLENNHCLFGKELTFRVVNLLRRVVENRENFSTLNLSRRSCGVGINKLLDFRRTLRSLEGE